MVKIIIIIFMAIIDFPICQKLIKKWKQKGFPRQTVNSIPIGWSNFAFIVVGWNKCLELNHHLFSKPKTPEMNARGHYFISLNGKIGYQVFCASTLEAWEITIQGHRKSLNTFHIIIFNAILNINKQVFRSKVQNLIEFYAL